ncbi:hypothetical protein [Roseicitreum antarcticum]|uniref:Uncharacterized protein n=1 Tax=Roseicitreum antarcticum TaxID=564137 RepID=A0A1H2XW83_9RHOB|nr:hypothetical protein [Roseicitreum antarcticum]SDW97097.1 hypothetical protein SAMN04488238_104332 [Roseicitreum antarcticum]
MAIRSPSLVVFLRLINVSMVASLTFIVAHQIQRVVVSEGYHLESGGNAVEFQVFSLIHGVRMGFAWMYGWCSVPLLLPALIYHSIYFNGWALPSVAFVVTSLMVSLSAPLALQFIRFAEAKPATMTPSPTEWRVVFVAGVMSAALNGMILQYFYGAAGAAQAAIWGALRWMASDTLGMMAAALVMWVTFKIFEIKPPHSP